MDVVVELTRLRSGLVEEAIPDYTVWCFVEGIFRVKEDRTGEKNPLELTITPKVSNKAKHFTESLGFDL